MRKLIIAVGLILALGCASQAQTSNFAFDGEVGSNGFGPNMTVAANGTQVVVMTDQHFSVYSYSGTLLKQTAFTTFLTAAGVTAGTNSEGRMVYDKHIGRFLAVCSCNASYLLVSDTDATGTWKGVTLGSDTGDLTMQQGYDKNGVYVTEFETGSTPFPGNYRLFAIPGADLAWVGAGTPSLTHLNTFTDVGYELMPAQDEDTAKAAGAAEYMITRNGSAGSSHLAVNALVRSLTWSGNTATLSGTTSISTGTFYTAPSNQAQAGSASLIKATESTRMWSASQNGSHLWAAMGSGPCLSSCGTQGVDAHDIALIYDIALPGLTLNSGSKISASTIGFYFPELATDSQGNVIVVMGGVSASTFPSIYSYYHLTTDSAGTMHGPTVQATGTQPYCGLDCNIAGNMAGAIQDPSNTLGIWFSSTYGTSASSGVWQSRLMQLQAGVAPSSPTPTGNFSSVQIGGAVQ